MPTKKRKIAAPVAKVWAALADFPAIATWAPQVDSLVGDHRGARGDRRGTPSPGRPDRSSGNHRRLATQQAARLHRRGPATSRRQRRDHLGARGQRRRDQDDGDHRRHVTPESGEPLCRAGAGQAARAGREADARRPCRKGRGRKGRGGFQVTNKPDVVILLTDEERAAPPYESDELAAWRDEHLHGTSGSTRTASPSPATTPARWPACRAGRRCSPATTRTCTASPRPTASARWPTTRGCAGCPRRGADARQLVPGGRLRHPLRRQVAHQPRRPDRRDGQAARHQHRRRDGPARRRCSPTSTPTRWRPTASPAGSGPSRTARAWPTAASAATRCSPTGGRLARGPLRPPRAPATPKRCGRSCWWPASSTRTTSCCSRRGAAAQPAQAARRSTRRTCPEAPTAARGPVAPSPRRRSPSAPPTPPATARRRRSSGSTRKGAQAYRDLYYRLHAEVDGPLDRVRRARRRAAAGDAVLVRTVRPRRAARRPRRAAPEVVQPLRRGDPRCRSSSRASATRSDRRAHGRPHRRRTSTSCRRCWPPPASTRRRVGKQLRRDFSEVHPLPGPRPDAGRRRRARGDSRARRLPADPRQHARGRHRASGLARRLGASANPPAPLRIQVAAHVGTSFEGIVARVDARRARGAATCGSWCAPSTTRRPGPSPASPPGRERHRRPEYRPEPLPDQWELYDLDDDPIEATTARRTRRTRGLRRACEPGSRRSGSAACPSATTRGPTSPADAETGREAASHRRPPGCSAGWCSGSACTPSDATPSSST